MKKIIPVSIEIEEYIIDKIKYHLNILFGVVAIEDTLFTCSIILN
jgi:hypothetical protein